MLIGLLIILITAILVLKRFLNNKWNLFLPKLLQKLIVVALWVLVMYLYLQSWYPDIFFLLDYHFFALRTFVTNEFLITISALVGVTFHGNNRQQKPVFYFTFLAIAILGLVYFFVNHAMDRYVTHLIPFFLLVASYGLYIMAKMMQRAILKYPNSKFLLWAIFIIPIISLIVLQSVTSLKGIREWGMGGWHTESYEELAANSIKSKVKNTKNILIVSFPEPYYYFSKYSTYSITDVYPFVYIDKKLDNNQVTIIQDMGMYDQFPAFSTFLSDHLKDKIVTFFWVHAPYRYADRVEKEKFPVTVYATSLFELKERIRTSSL